VRIDPHRDVISMLSIPRDLKVEIPGYGRDRFNAAYAYDGAPLTLKVVTELTGVEVNHLINIDFRGFAAAVDAIKCVFIDVDRQYYVPEGTGHSAIDPAIEAGYQRLCGFKALQYARYRVGDNDIVRAARQQEFIREARQKLDPAKLLLDERYRYELVEVLHEYTESGESLSSTAGISRPCSGATDAVVEESRFRPSWGRRT
jgi:LCP family protein required for cell wall assembly